MILISLKNNSMFVPLSQLAFTLEGNEFKVVTADLQQLIDRVPAAGVEGQSNDDRLRATIKQLGKHIQE